LYSKTCIVEREKAIVLILIWFIVAFITVVVLVAAVDGVLCVLLSFMIFVLGSKVTGVVVRIVDDYRSSMKFMRLEGLGALKK
jgi:uncharacterized membrane protein